MASKSVKKKAEKTLDAAESLIEKSKDKAKDQRKITSQSKKLTEKQGKGVSVVEGEGVKTIKNFGKAKKGGENIRSRRKSETKTDTKADTKSKKDLPAKSKKNLPAKLKDVEKTLGRKLTKKEIAGLVSAGLLTTGAASLLSPIKAKDKTTESNKKPTTTRGKPTVEGEKRRVGAFAPGFRPFKGKLAKILLGEDEQFGGSKGGLLDPNLGLGVRRGGRSVATTITTKDKDGNVISKHTERKRLNPEVSAKKDRKDVPKKNMGGMMKAKGKANGGMMKAKGRANGGAMKKKKGYATGGSAKKFPDLSGDGKVTQKDILMGRGAVKKKNGGIMKKKNYATGGMAKKGSAKGGAATKAKRTSKRKSSMGAAIRGGGAIMR